MFDDVYWHMDIREGKKPGTGGTANLRLGTPLMIDTSKEKYEDLDEAVARHIEPVAGFLRDAVMHRKFLGGRDHEVDEHCKSASERTERSAHMPCRFQINITDICAFRTLFPRVETYIMSTSKSGQLDTIIERWSFLLSIACWHTSK